jgi:hypothetical protein
MELVLWLVGIVAFAWLLSIPARRYEKRTGKKLGRGAGAAVLDSLNVIYQPSAAHSAEILNEQREQRTAIPSAADKPFDDKTITIVVSDKS